MPALTAINNTYTANTPEGVRQCLGFVSHRARLQAGRDAAFRAYPISIAYGSGSIGSDYGQLVMAGDFLDIIPAQGDRVRRRRWWQASHDASSQGLLPFAAYNRARITSIQQYSHATEIVVQFGRDSQTRLNLTAPRIQDAIGPYTVRAIRIHNVDGSETVQPMRSCVEEEEAQSLPHPSPYPCVAAPNQIRVTPPADVERGNTWWGPSDAPEPSPPERPITTEMEILEAARVRGRARRPQAVVRGSIPIRELRPRSAREAEVAMAYGFLASEAGRTRGNNEYNA